MKEFSSPPGDHPNDPPPQNTPPVVQPFGSSVLDSGGSTALPEPWKDPPEKVFEPPDDDEEIAESSVLSDFVEEYDPELLGRLTSPASGESGALDRQRLPVSLATDHDDNVPVQRYAADTEGTVSGTARPIDENTVPVPRRREQFAQAQPQEPRPLPEQPQFEDSEPPDTLREHSDETREGTTGASSVASSSFPLHREPSEILMSPEARQPLVTAAATENAGTGPSGSKAESLETNSAATVSEPVEVPQNEIEVGQPTGEVEDAAETVAVAVSSEDDESAASEPEKVQIPGEAGEGNSGDAPPEHRDGRQSKISDTPDHEDLELDGIAESQGETADLQESVEWQWFEGTISRLATFALSLGREGTPSASEAALATGMSLAAALHPFRKLASFVAEGIAASAGAPWWGCKLAGAIADQMVNVFMQHDLDHPVNSFRVALARAGQFTESAMYAVDGRLAESSSFRDLCGQHGLARVNEILNSGVEHILYPIFTSGQQTVFDPDRPRSPGHQAPVASSHINTTSHPGDRPSMRTDSPRRSGFAGAEVGASSASPSTTAALLEGIRSRPNPKALRRGRCPASARADPATRTEAARQWHPSYSARRSSPRSTGCWSEPALLRKSSEPTPQNAITSGVLIAAVRNAPPTSLPLRLMTAMCQSCSRSQSRFGLAGRSFPPNERTFGAFARHVVGAGTDGTR